MTNRNNRRRAPPGKCKYKPLPVKVRGKKVLFSPRELTVLGVSETPTRSPLEKIILPTKPPGTRQPTRAKATTSAAKKKTPSQTTTAKERQEKAKMTTQPKEKQVNASAKTLKKAPLIKKSILQTKKNKKVVGKPPHNPKTSIKGAPERKKAKPLKPLKPMKLKPKVWLQKTKKTGKEVKKPVKSKPAVTASKKNKDSGKVGKNSPLTKKERAV